MPVTPFLGQIMPAAFGIVPKGWAMCNGSLLAIQTNSALFSLLGTTFGGNGVTTFALPDLRGRAVLGSDIRGQAPWGQIAGTETVQLTTNQIPSHTHTLQASTTVGQGRGSNPAGNLFGVAGGTQPPMIFAAPDAKDIALSSSTNVQNVGGNLPHNNMQPYLVINYLIALTGVFPPRP